MEAVAGLVCLMLTMALYKYSARIKWDNMAQIPSVVYMPVSVYNPTTMDLRGPLSYPSVISSAPPPYDPPPPPYSQLGKV